MRIVTLDGYTLTPLQPGQRSGLGEPSWSSFEEIGELTVHDRTPDDRIAQRAAGAEAILTNKTNLTAQTLEQLPDLRYIGVLATGTNVIDLDAARQRGITVTNVPGYGSESVAQHVFALLLELVNHTARHADAVRQGGWANQPDFSFTVAPMTELAGKTLGIVGLGDIGQRTAQIGHAFGMAIASVARESTMKRVHLPGIDIRWLPTDELFAESDAISLHCPLTPETAGLINADRLKRMKPSSYLINTGRGGLVDEDALAEALRQEEIAGAGLDVLSSEPPAPDNPLVGAPRCIVTPHIAWATKEARTRLMQIAADNLRSFLAGKPQNVVN